MKRSVLLFTCVSLLLLSSIVNEHIVAAQVNEAEIQQYLINNNWSMDELVDYLQFYDMEIADFATIGELEDFLGSPITNENLNELLGEYGIDYNDLEIMLAEYGETLDDYKFIEDLDLDVKFFLAYQDEFSISNDFLSLFGLTEDETQNLFNHVSGLDDDQTREKLDNIFASLEELEYLRDKDDHLSEEDQGQIFLLWNEMLETLNIDVKFFLVKEETMMQVDIKDLMTKEVVNGYSLQMSLHNLTGEQLATLVYSDELLNSYLMYEALDQVAQVVKLADDYRVMLEMAKLPKTAGHFVTNILLSIFMIVSGFAMLVAVRRKANA